MKKISILMALMVMVGVASTSCKRDTQPRLDKPTEFVLNTPPFASNTLILSEDGTVQLTCSQPNYGPAVVADYTVDVAIDDPVANPRADFRRVDYTSEQAVLDVPAGEIALAMCQLMGAVDEASADKYDDSVRPVWVRVVASVPHADYSEICSNWVKFEKVQPFFAVPVPGKIWVIGDCTGWSIDNPTPEYILCEADDAIGSQIYSGTFPISAEQAANGFRFYTQLGDWGDNGSPYSIGSNPNDGDNLSVTLDEDLNYSGACVYGKGNWNIQNHPGGNLKMTVDLNTMKVYFEAVD